MSISFINPRYRMKTFFHHPLNFLAVSFCLFCPGATVAEERLPRTRGVGAGTILARWSLRTVLREWPVIWAI